MGEKQGETAETGAIVGGELQQWSQLPDESSQAYAGFLAYADLPPGQQTITAAYRALKGTPDNESVKPPGYFGAWASKYSWRPTSERSETANRLHDMIESEQEALESMKDRKWKFGGDPVDKSARLANLAAALKDAAAARLMVLGGEDT